MLKKITYTVLLFISSFVVSQTVSTVTDGNFHDGIGMDSQGNIYCSDYYGDAVYKYDINGNVTTFKSGFTNPNGVDVNDQDEIFICDAGSGIVYRYDTNGNEIATYSTGITNPTGIRNIPGTNDMLLVEWNTSTLKKLALDGTVTTLFTGFPLNGPSGIAFINDEVYISNYNDRKIMYYENGTLTLVTQLPTSGFNNNAIGFLTATNDKLYATHLGAHKIYAIDPTNGDATIYAGSTVGNTNGDISSAKFNLPNGILADVTNDKMYISDAGTKNLRIIENATLSTSEVFINRNNLTVVVDEFADNINVSVNLSSKERVSLKVFEITGKEIFNENFSVAEFTFSKQIDKSKFKSGVYIVVFAQGNKLVNKKIIIP